MTVRNLGQKLTRILSAVIFCFVVSCGGGTTGTSSTGELKMQGRAEKISGQPLSQAELVVFSTTSDKPLIASNTDLQGRFNLLLPGSEVGVTLELEGERLDPFIRKYKDSSVLTTVIVKQSKPNANSDKNSKPRLPSRRVFGENGSPKLPSRRFFNVQYTFELHINTDTLCTALSTRDNQIFIDKPIELSECKIEIEAFSDELENESFYAQLIGICDENTMPISLSRATSAGVMTIDISEAYNRQCKSLRISAYSVRASDTRVVFPINDALDVESGQ